MHVRVWLGIYTDLMKNKTFFAPLGAGLIGVGGGAWRTKPDVQSPVLVAGSCCSIGCRKQVAAALAAWWLSVNAMQSGLALHRPQQSAAVPL